MTRGMFYGSVDGPAADFRWLRKHDFQFVVTAPDEELSFHARNHRLEHWVCLGTFPPTSKREDELCVGLDGRRHLWFNSGCPNEPKIRRASIEAYRKAAAIEDVAVVMMDGVRYASPASGLDAFFTCFCGRCACTAGRLGYDFDRMRRDVACLYERMKSGELPFPPVLADSPATVLGQLTNLPGVIDWLGFRARVIEGFVAEVADVVHSQGKRFGGFVFSPCLAPLVGQDYPALAKHFDTFAPMLYRNVKEPNCIAPVNTEIHTLLSWATSQSAEAVPWALSFFGLPGKGLRQVDDLLHKGLSADAMRIETTRARALIGPKRELSPIVWHDDRAVRLTMAATIEGGADSVSVFILNGPLMRRLKH